MAPPAVRKTLKKGRDRSIKHTDGEINVSIEIKRYLLSTQKVADDSLKRPLGQICIFWGILAAARLDPHSLQGAAGAVEAGPQLVLVVS